MPNIDPMRTALSRHTVRSIVHRRRAWDERPSSKSLCFASGLPAKLSRENSSLAPFQNHEYRKMSQMSSMSQGSLMSINGFDDALAVLHALEEGIQPGA